MPPDKLVADIAAKEKRILEILEEVRDLLGTRPS
jgi:hypothetical protein